MSSKRLLDDAADASKRAKGVASASTEKVVKDIMAALYGDINGVCLVRDMIPMTAKQPDIDWYRSQGDKATEFVGRAAALMLNPADMIPHTADIRIRQILQQNGWITFAMCVWSETFRLACMEAEQGTWDVLLNYIWKNCCSIEAFARYRLLDWRGPLLNFTSYNLPGLQAVLAPDYELSDEHPRRIVGTECSELTYPIFEGHTIYGLHNYSLFDPTKWPKDGIDSAPRKTSDGSCMLCNEKRGDCFCQLAPLAGTYVEVVRYPNKGLGIRALSNLKKGDILDYFAMEFPPFKGDGYRDKHALTVQATNGDSAPIALVSLRRYRVWHDWLNTSCNASTEWREIVFGDSTISVIEVTRDISFGEEITISER